MKKVYILVAVLIMSACTAEPSMEATVESTTVPPTEQSATEASQLSDQPSSPMPNERGELFAASGVCAACHTKMTDEAGNDVSNDVFWRSSMMANASRDPYWRASVMGEVLSNPEYQAVIEDKCATCHTPMARYTAFVAGDAGKLFQDGFFHQDNEIHTLALDGVSCTLCHQIQEEGFGEQEGYSGGFVIDKQAPTGERIAFGPYAVDEALAVVMQGASGFAPVESPHVEESELCATCHTLYTPYLDAKGEIAGEFPEQMPYLEWLHSDYPEAKSCQGCHMPQAQGGVVLSITGGEPRSPFYQHEFVGGNVYMLDILRTYGEEMNVIASEAEFAAKAMSVSDQLQNRTVSITADASLSDSELLVNVAVESHVGHKFPSGFPARRTWLNVTIADAEGQVLFESGAVNPDGSIIGNDNDSDPKSYEPHYQSIDSPDQVQIYEAIMQDTEGSLTTTLLRGAAYVKDNRLLPTGFDKLKAPSDIAVSGLAFEDQDFLGGEDTIQYEVDIGDAEGPFTVTVNMFYQSISSRWAENLRQYDALEISDFIGYYESIPNLPVLAASQV
ncbi:MAG: hypothetical protein PVG32_14145, partial [Anaerolineales bacterium]